MHNFRHNMCIYFTSSISFNLDITSLKLAFGYTCTISSVKNLFLLMKLLHCDFSITSSNRKTIEVQCAVNTNCCTQSTVAISLIYRHQYKKITVPKEV